MSMTSTVAASERLSLERLAAFSDGVIAIAITILVLGLEVPSVHEVPKSELVEFLRDALHPVVGYVVSFVLVLTYWLEHYVIFHVMTYSTRALVALNGLFLLCVTFLPFPTGLQAAYRHDELAMVLYCLAQFLCGLSLLSIWLYATWNRQLVDPTLSALVIRKKTLRILVTPTISLLAIGCSFISISLSRFIFLVIPMCYFCFGPGIKTQHSSRPASDGTGTLP